MACRADVLYRFLRPRTQASMDLVLYIVFFLPAIAAWIYSGFLNARMSVQFREVSIFSPAGVPIFPLKALIPLTGLLLLLKASPRSSAASCVFGWATGHSVSTTWKKPSYFSRNPTPCRPQRWADGCKPLALTRKPAHDRSASRHVDAGTVHFHHHVGFSDRVHVDRNGPWIWVLCRLHARPGGF